MIDDSKMHAYPLNTHGREGLMMTPLEEIRAERQRQIEVEGFDAEHDDRHTTEDLTEAALAYEAHAMGTAVYDERGIPTSWPWEAFWWKPKGRRCDLVRAGALALAEQERWERDGMPSQALPAIILERVIGELEAIEVVRKAYYGW